MLYVYSQRGRFHTWLSLEVADKKQNALTHKKQHILEHLLAFVEQDIYNNPRSMLQCK